jgi:hypothetical protein
MSHNGTGRYILGDRYRDVLVQENVNTSKPDSEYVRVRTQLRTERYRAVQQGTGQYTKWYKAVQVKVQQGTLQGSLSTWRYMSVHGLHLRRAAGLGGGRFWCAFQIAAFTAPTVASASSHCMHKLVYSSLGGLARASPASATGPPFATRGPGPGSGGGGGGWRCRGRRLASRSRSRGWRRHIPIPGPIGALGRRGGGRRDVNMWRRRGV